MGNRRMGLGRLEALLEAVDRDLDLTNSTLTSPTISKCVSLTAAKLHQSPSCAAGTPTDISATALTVNTFYKSIAGATAMTIPSCAAGNIGDFIVVFYSTAINNSVAHTYTTTTDASFAAGSTCQRVGGAVGSSGAISNGTNHNTLTITGATNGDGGVGTIVRFVNMTGLANGWAVEAITYNQGDGSTAGAISLSNV